MDSTAFTALRLERVGLVLRVTIDHPASELNTVDALLHHELKALFAGLRDERDARAIVLTGAGRAFSAGGDFGWFPELRDVERLDALRHDARQLITDLLDVELPIVAAVNGPAVGLARVDRAALRRHRDGGPRDSCRPPRAGGDRGRRRRRGHLAPGGGSGARQAVPVDRGPVDRVEAERIGLVNRVVPSAELDTEAMTLAARLAGGAPLAVRYTKLAVNKLVKEALNVAFDASTALELLTFLSEDHQEALRAMNEKRPPDFHGR